MIENLDRNIGLLVESLKRRNLLESAIIVFTSDNGGHFGITKQRPLRAGKGTYYDGGIRVPFFIHSPYLIAEGSTNHTPVTHLDLFPTLIDLLKIDAKGSLDGVSLLPLIRGDSLDLNKSLFWYFPIYLESYNVQQPESRDPLFRTRPGSVIRSGNWKLHYYFEDEGIELYNLNEDPGEALNVAKQNHDKVMELMVDMRQWWKRTDVPIPSKINPLYSPKTEPDQQGMH